MAKRINFENAVKPDIKINSRNYSSVINRMTDFSKINFNLTFILEDICFIEFELSKHSMQLYKFLFRKLQWKNENNLIYF